MFDKKPLEVLLYNIRNYFEEYCSQIRILTKEREEIPFELNKIQRTFIHNFHTRNIVVKPRQIGFSTLCKALMCFIASFTEHMSVGVLYQDDKMAKLNGRDLRNFVDGVGSRTIEMLGKKVNLKISNELRGKGQFLVDPNDTLFLFDSAGADNPFRSLTIPVLWGSEAGSWSKGSSAWEASYPAVPDNGIIIIESTPSIRQGTFFRDQYVKAKSNISSLDVNVLDLNKRQMKPHFFSFFDFPGFSLSVPETWKPNQDDIEFMRTYEKFVSADSGENGIDGFAYFRRLELGEKPTFAGMSEFKSNYPIDDASCWEASSQLAEFDTNKVESMESRIPLNVKEDYNLRSSVLSKYDPAKLRVYQSFSMGDTYFIGVDTSTGTGGDSNALVVINKDDRICAVFNSNITRYNDFCNVVGDIATYYGGAYVMVEENNLGIAVIDQVKTITSSIDDIKRNFRNAKVKPFKTYANSLVSSKAILVSNVNTFINKSNVIYDEELKIQLLVFSTNRDIAKNQKDDLVIALGLAYQCKKTNYRNFSNSMRVSILPSGKQSWIIK